MSETDNDGWQVAGRRKGRRRSKFAAGAPADRSSGCYPSQQSTVSCLTGTNRNQCVPRLIGFRYKNSAKHDNECAFEQRLAEEVRKIERIQELLKQSVFWERLEIGLQTTLSSLGLSARAARMESNTSTSQGSRQSETGVLHVETSTQIHARDGLIQAELPVVATASHSVTTSPTSLISSRVHHDGGGEQELSKCLLESYCRFDPSARDANAPEPISNGAPCGGCAGSDDGCEQCAGLYEIVCYGIGRFCESHNSRYQLALALCLRDMLLPCVGRSSGDVSPRHEELEEDIKRDMYQLDGSRPQLLMFDPVLGEFEKATLTRLGCQMIQENEKGKRSCCRPPESDQNEAQPSGCRRRPTLFFMPHCPRRLYSNLLWANWSHLGLSSTIVLGNSFSWYRNQLRPSDIALDPSDAIMQSEALVDELRLHRCPPGEKARWRLDVERLPHMELAFSDLTLSYSSLERLTSTAGRQALLKRPMEFIEQWEGARIYGIR